MQSDAGPTFFVGHHDTERSEPASTLLIQQAQNAGYDMMTSPITNAAFRDLVLALVDTHLNVLKQSNVPSSIPIPLVPSITPAYTTLTPDASLPSLLVFTSPWIDIGSHDPVVAHVSRQVLNQEIAYAAFCGVNNIIVPGPDISPRSCHVAQFARTIAYALQIGPYFQLHISLPISLQDALGSSKPLLWTRTRHVYREIGSKSAYSDSTSWEAWDSIRSVCRYNGRLSVALDVPKQIHAQNVLSRWYSEPVRIMIYPSGSFVSNGRGYPVLPKASQTLINHYMTLKPPPWHLLADVGAIPGNTDNGLIASIDPTPAQAASSQARPAADPTAHLSYMRHLQQTQPPRSPIDRFAAGYQDYLQSPLQPLTDHLESITYEVFEKDPIKYDWYERAIALALRDLYAKLNRPIVVAVVGAGRGPLVTRALMASGTSSVPIVPFAVEKNPNAYVVLLHHNATNPLWNNSVQVVKTDMRSWNGPISPNTGGVMPVDILVSELLGSFADNELSPECLDGVQHVLHPAHGINIPQSYSAHITPISTPRIYADLSHRPDEEKWNLPYVAMLHQYDWLSRQSHGTETLPDIQQTWSFSHPLPSSILAHARLREGGSEAAGGFGGLVGGNGANEHNARSCKLTFRAQHRGVCHGLAGYFETVLYESTATGEKVELSTNPNTMADKSKDMISWFPIFFPLKTPLHVPDDADMELSMWRQTDDRKVWYEWLVEVFVTVNGKRQRCAVSDLHSSWKNGCLM